MYETLLTERGCPSILRAQIAAIFGTLVLLSGCGATHSASEDVVSGDSSAKTGDRHETLFHGVYVGMERSLVWKKLDGLSTKGRERDLFRFELAGAPVVAYAYHFDGRLTDLHLQFAKQCGREPAGVECPAFADANKVASRWDRLLRAKYGVPAAEVGAIAASAGNGDAVYYQAEWKNPDVRIRLQRQARKGVEQALLLYAPSDKLAAELEERRRGVRAKERVREADEAAAQEREWEQQF